MAVLISGFCASTGFLVYQTVNEGLVQALFVPASGVALKEVGRYCKSETISELGDSMMLASVFTVPGMFSGYAVYALGGKTLVAKTIACVTGSVVTYKVYGDLLSRAFDLLWKSVPFGR